MTPPTPTRSTATRPGRLPLAGSLAVLALAGLAACSHPIGSTANRAGATPKEMVACRQRADEVYNRRNPAEVYHSDMVAGGQRDAPFGDWASRANRARACRASMRVRPCWTIA